MKKKKSLILVLQILLVLAFAFSFYNYVQTEVEPVNVYMFNKDLPKNSAITGADLREVTIPAKAVMSSYILNPQDIIGMVTAIDVQESQYVTIRSIKTEKEIDYFETLDMSHYRLISIPTNYETGLGGYLSRGDFVDLIYVGEGEYDNGVSLEDFYYGVTFLQDIPIYKLVTTDGYMFNTKADMVKGEEGDVSSNEVGNIIVLVTLEEAEEISVRLKSGEIRLAKRLAGSETYDTTGFTIGKSSEVITSHTNPEEF